MSASRSSWLTKEDWWAVWIGLFILCVGIVLWRFNGSLDIISFKMSAWDDLSDVLSVFREHAGTIILLYVVFLLIFSIAVKCIGYPVKMFASGFTLLFLLGLFTITVSSWEWAQQFQLEAPLVALIIGLILSNLLSIPNWLQPALRTEFYVKVGIVLLGATLPLSLIVKTGPLAFTQAAIVSVATFLAIYWSATRWFGLDPRFASTLGAGGSVCGVSASIAVGSTVRTKKEHISISISLVVVWAVIMIFALTALIRFLEIPHGAAGAWIGTSEFADAAGMAAASAIGEEALGPFTVMKVIGRDMFIGVWCFVLAFVSITRWEKKETNGAKANVADIWHRFPKFIVGFLIASALVTIINSITGAAAEEEVNSALIAPIKNIRTWAFVFCFLSIGLTTRFKDIRQVGWRPLAAFTFGVLVNLPLGYLLSVLIFGSYWNAMGH